MENKRIEIDEVFELISRERNGLASIHTAFKDFPQGVLAHYTFYKSLMLEDKLPLIRAEREYLAFKTSEYNQCPYCIGHHQIAFNNCSTKEMDNAKFSILDKLSFALTKEPWKTSVIKKSFLLTGFNEAQWQHAVMIVSYFNFANRCAHAMDLELENGFENTCE